MPSLDFLAKNFAPFIAGPPGTYGRAINLITELRLPYRIMYTPHVSSIPVPLSLVIKVPAFGDHSGYLLRLIDEFRCLPFGSPSDSRTADSQDES